MIGGDAVGDRLHQQGLAGLGRRNDQAALPTPNRRHQIDQPGSNHMRLGRELQLLIRKDRRELVEVRPIARRFGIDAVDQLNPQQAEVALIFFGWSYLAGDPVSSPQAEAPDLGLRHIHIVRPRQHPVAAQKAKAIGDDIQNAGAKGIALLLGLRMHQLHDQILLAQAQIARNF